MDDAEAVSEISKMLDPPNKVRKMKDWNPGLQSLLVFEHAKKIN